VVEQTLKTRIARLKESRKRARQEIGPLRSRVYAVQQELEELERAILQELEEAGGPPPRAIPCPVCRLPMLYGKALVRDERFIHFSN